MHCFTNAAVNFTWIFKGSLSWHFFQLFSGYFDTTTGPKTDAESYKKIKAEIDTDGDLQPDEILFLTDDPAGMFK